MKSKFEIKRCSIHFDLGGKEHIPATYSPILII